VFPERNSRKLAKLSLDPTWCPTACAAKSITATPLLLALVCKVNMSGFFFLKIYEIYLFSSPF
jgi:hypothetical protein